MSLTSPSAVEYLRGRPGADRPFAPIVGSLAAAVSQVPGKAFLSDPTQLANGLQRVHRLFELDVVFVVPDPTLLAEGLGVAVEWDESATRFVPGETLDEDAKLPDPNSVTDRGRLPVILDAADRLVTSLDDVAVFGVLPGPHTTAEAMFGESVEASDDRTRAIRTATGEVARSFGRNGVHGFLVAETPSTIGSERTGEGAVDVGVETLDVLDNISEFFGAVLGFAPCGYASSAVDAVVERANLDAVFIETDDPATATGRFEDVRIGGGVTESLLERDDDEIQRRAKAMVTDLPPEGFLASGRDVPDDVHPRKLQHVQRAAAND